MSGDRFVDGNLRTFGSPQSANVLIRSFLHIHPNVRAIAFPHRDNLQKLQTADAVASRNDVNDATWDSCRQTTRSAVLPEENTPEGEESAPVRGGPFKGLAETESWSRRNAWKKGIAPAGIAEPGAAQCD